MLKFSILFAFIAFEASAAHVLLEKHAASGLIIPEQSFKKDCSIYREGYVESYIRKGDGTITGFTHAVSFRRIWEIRQLLRVARHASLFSGPIPCDAGSVSVFGHYANKPILIQETVDCVSNKSRNGWSAERLRNMAYQICAF